MVLALLFSGLVAIIFVLWTDSTRQTVTHRERRRAHMFRMRLRAELDGLQRRYTSEKAVIQTGDAMHVTPADWSFVRDDVRSLGRLSAREAAAILNALLVYTEQASRLAGHGGTQAEAHATSLPAFDFDLHAEGNRQRAETAMDRIIAALNAAVATLRAAPMTVIDDRYPHVTAWLSPRHQQM